MIHFQVDITPKGAEGGENYEEGSEVRHFFKTIIILYSQNHYRISKNLQIFVLISLGGIRRK